MINISTTFSFSTIYTSQSIFVQFTLEANIPSYYTSEFWILSLNIKSSSTSLFYVKSLKVIFFFSKSYNIQEEEKKKKNMKWRKEDDKKKEGKKMRRKRKRGIRKWKEGEQYGKTILTMFFISSIPLHTISTIFYQSLSTTIIILIIWENN